MRPDDVETIDRLVAAAKDMREKAYAPYSRFQVGAAVLADGQISRGANVENASYPLRVCAERNAVAAAVLDGRRTIDAVAVVGDEDRPTPPCGGCRQVLWEFGRSSLVIAETPGGTRVMWALEDLLPDAFGPEDLLS